MFLPYKDDNPTRSIPIVNWLLILANLWVFSPGNFHWARRTDGLFLKLWLYSGDIFWPIFLSIREGLLGNGTRSCPPCLAMEGSYLFGNMLFLYLYGDNLEDAMGKIRYLIFYLGCSSGGISTGVFEPGVSDSDGGCIEAISGVIGGCYCFYRKQILGFSTGSSF